MPATKVRMLDIETSHLKADFGTLLAVGHKTLTEKRVHVPTILDFDPSSAIDDEGIVREAHRILMDTDILVTYYGKGFDMKFLNAKFLEYNLPILANIPHIDLFFTAKSNLALSRKSLANVAYFLKLENTKTPVEGRIWKQAMIGEPGAIKYVKDHCRSDVLLLEEAYMRLRPLVRMHPRVNDDPDSCPGCGGTKHQKRGLYYTKRATQHRVQCTEVVAKPNGTKGPCGQWYRLPYEKEAA